MDTETEGSLGLTVYQHQSKLSEEFISEESGQSDRVVSLSFYVAFFMHYCVHMCTQTPIYMCAHVYVHTHEHIHSSIK